MLNTKKKKIKTFWTYSHINLHAFYLKIEKILRVWYIGRTLYADNQKTPGYVGSSFINEFWEFITTSRGNKISSTHFYRILDQGNGIFWEIAKSRTGIERIRFYTPDEVASHIYQMTDFTEVPVQDLLFERARGPFHSPISVLSTMRSFNAHLFKSILFSVDLKILKTKENVGLSSKFKSHSSVKTRKAIIFKELWQPRQISTRRMAELMHRSQRTIINYIKSSEISPNTIKSMPILVAKARNLRQAIEIVELKNSEINRTTGFAYRQLGDTYLIFEQESYKYTLSLKQFYEKDIAINGIISNALRRYRRRFKHRVWSP